MLALTSQSISLKTNRKTLVSALLDNLVLVWAFWHCSINTIYVHALRKRPEKLVMDSLFFFWSYYKYIWYWPTMYSISAAIYCLKATFYFQWERHVVICLLLCVWDMTNAWFWSNVLQYNLDLTVTMIDWFLSDEQYRNVKMAKTRLQK